MIKRAFNNKVFYLILVFYIILVIWWTRIFFLGIRESNENYLFGYLYSFIALIGGIQGFFIAKKWGGRKSLIGNGIIFLSLGLLGEWFGQTAWSYYNIIAKVEVPYPSIADIGYFSIIPFYALGIVFFAKACGAKFSLKTLKGKLISLIIPIIILAISYFLFLRDLSFDLNNPIRAFLDFGYPIGEAITISIALVTFGLLKGMLGGKMKGPILYLIFAFLIQYITDSLFLYEVATGKYYNAGLVDLMYTTSFTIMASGLILFNDID